MITLGIWIAAFLTLCIYSFLYKDNPFYKLAEHIYVGVSTGYLVIIMINDALMRDIYEPLFVNAKKEYIVIFPAIMGLLVFTQMTKKWAWLSRISISFIVGVAMGIAVPNQIQTYLLKHTEATIVPLWSSGGGFFAGLNEFLILIGVITVLIYFFFSVKHSGPIKPVARTGIVFLMLFFGSAFGYTVMGRVSLLIGRMRFLLIDWLHLG